MNCKGFSLVEAMLATVVLGIASAGILLPFSSGAGMQAEGAHQTLGAKLASDLMEKIVSTPYENVIESYGSFNEAKGQIRDINGAIFADPMYSNFSRSASCAYAYTVQESGTGTSKYILATVRVFYNDCQIAMIKRLITK